ncbi:acyltransferase family protein [Larkinella knui]|uniref:Acyltransferase n=1 Tax=Larkinella knui TaxID=2025310 RepID=A0A3P1CL96_9BACT|nr:acyltransferase [Larkinella knui]RRB14065.1 acyltransferase [Larkinella knui]
MKHNINFYWLDFLRGSAALLVFLSHIRALFFLDYHHVDHTIISAFFYFITGFGHSSVIVFFVLSGFFIIGSIDNAASKNKWSFTTYSIDRLVRLWIVLLPALLLTALLDNIGLKLYPDSLAYLGEIDSLRDINPIGRSTIVVFLANVFFLQNVLVPTFGSNAPLWSLSCEFWYYFLFPFLYFALFKKENVVAKIALITIPVLLLLLLGNKIAGYFTIWLMGGITFFIYKYKNIPIFNTSFFAAFSSLLFLVIFSCIRFDKYPFLFNNYSLGATSILLMIALINSKMKFPYLIKFSKFISNISYSLYLIHLPLSIVLVSALSHERHDFNAISIMTFLALCALIVTFSYCFWHLFEKQTSAIKIWVKSKLLPSIATES